MEGSEAMEKLETYLAQSQDVREVKRGLCVKMVLSGMAGGKVAALLGVSPQYVSKWKGLFATQGVASLGLGYQGSQGFLSPEERAKVFGWLEEQMQHKHAVTLEQLRDEIEVRFGVVYRSRQSYYDLLHAAKASYHKTQKQNPKRDEAKVLERRAAIKKTHLPRRGDSKR